jgi:hypothetical protein
MREISKHFDGESSGTIRLRFLSLDKWIHWCLRQAERNWNKGHSTFRIGSERVVAQDDYDRSIGPLFRAVDETFIGYGKRSLERRYDEVHSTIEVFFRLLVLNDAITRYQLSAEPQQRCKESDGDSHDPGCEMPWLRAMRPEKHAEV